MYYILRLLPILILLQPSLGNKVQEVSRFKTNFFSWIKKNDTLDVFNDSNLITEIEEIIPEFVHLTRSSFKHSTELFKISQEIYSLYKEPRDSDWGNKSVCIENLFNDLADFFQTCESSYAGMRDLILGCWDFFCDCNECSTESVFKQWKCYVNAMSNFTKILHTAIPTIEKELAEVTSELQAIKSNFVTCFFAHGSK